MISFQTFATAAFAFVVWIFSTYKIIFQGDFSCLVYLLTLGPLAIIYKFGLQKCEKKTRFDKPTHEKQTTDHDLNDVLTKLKFLSKSIDENYYDHLIMILSSLPTEDITEICSKAKMLKERLKPEEKSITSNSNTDMDLIDSIDTSHPHLSDKNDISLLENKYLDHTPEPNTDDNKETHSDEKDYQENTLEDVSLINESNPHLSDKNDKCLLDNKYLDPMPESSIGDYAETHSDEEGYQENSQDDASSNDTSNTHLSDKTGTCLLDKKCLDHELEPSTDDSEEIHSDKECYLENPQDVSSNEAFYYENQQNAFEFLIKANFHMGRLPENAYCREWLLQHAECCLQDSVSEISNHSKDLQTSVENVSTPVQDLSCGNSPNSNKREEQDIVFGETKSSQRDSTEEYSCKVDSVNSSPNKITGSGDNESIVTSQEPGEIFDNEIISNETQTLKNIQDHLNEMKTDPAEKPEDCKIMDENDYLPSNKFDDLEEMNYVNLENEDKIENVSKIEAQAWETQQETFEEIIKFEFQPISRLLTRPYCQEWLLKHTECCLQSNSESDVQKLNKNAISEDSNFGENQSFTNLKEPSKEYKDESDFAEITFENKNHTNAIRTEFVENYDECKIITENDGRFPRNQFLDDLPETVSDHPENVDTVEDVSSREVLYWRAQQEAFEDFIRPNFPAITRLPNNAYCREWLLKHSECCCLVDSMQEPLNDTTHSQKSNQNYMSEKTIECSASGNKNTRDDEFDVMKDKRTVVSDFEVNDKFDIDKETLEDCLKFNVDSERNIEVNMQEDFSKFKFCSSENRKASPEDVVKNNSPCKKKSSNDFEVNDKCLIDKETLEDCCKHNVDSERIIEVDMPEDFSKFKVCSSKNRKASPEDVIKNNSPCKKKSSNDFEVNDKCDIDKETIEDCSKCNVDSESKIEVDMPEDFSKHKICSSENRKASPEDVIENNLPCTKKSSNACLRWLSKNLLCCLKRKSERESSDKRFSKIDKETIFEFEDLGVSNNSVETKHANCDTNGSVTRQKLEIFDNDNELVKNPTACELFISQTTTKKRSSVNARLRWLLKHVSC